MRHARGERRRRRVAERLHAAAIHLLRRLRVEDAASGLSPARLSALSVLVFGGTRSLGELAAAEGVQPPTMSRLVAALEREGYVARESDARDARVVRVRATERGVEALEAGRARRIDRLSADLAGLDAEELTTLAAAAELVETVVSGAAGSAQPARRRRRPSPPRGRRPPGRSLP